MFILERIEMLYRKFNKIFNRPPDLLNNNSKIFYQKKLKSDWRALKFLDLIIYLFVFATINQLIFVFGKGDAGFADYSKAIGFALAEAHFARSAGKAWIAGLSARPIWIALFIVMVLLIPLNIVYDWAKLANTNKFDSSIISHDWLSLFLSIVGSGIISVMILGVSYIRMVQEKIFFETQKSFDRWIKEEEKRVERNKYQRKYIAQRRQKMREKNMKKK